jgi:NAD(P)-dependent dehydrogenase (short-subunit alcohol dehydrogenase family)
VRGGAPRPPVGGRVTSGLHDSLAGKVAVVTGGAGGIGRAVVAQLVQQGASVVLVDISPGQEYIAQTALTIAADVSDRESVAGAARQVLTELGRCDILVMAAGIAVVGTAGDSTEQDWDRVFDINVKGAWLTFQEFLPLLSRPSSLVTIASAAGLRPMPELAAYSAAKAALISLTRSIALDYAKDQIRANCVCPGQIATALADNVQDQRGDVARESVASFADYPIKRAGRPEEVAAAVTYLCQPQAGYVTGSVLTVDGGRTLH